MRLLNLTTYEMKEFFGKSVPKYAILSHRWEDGEVSLQDFQRGGYESKAGYAKIKGTCTRATKEGHEWVWIDTCCIDKTSSAELSEAINSMYAWYERAQICYAYLSDVSQQSMIKQSLWFTRGWTLQELLAPEEVTFLNKDWMVLGQKRDHGWPELLTEITGISDFTGFRWASVAQKMSWLSRRETTRIEDMAYCMLGLFGVYMPPLYGEEDHAFHRLQLEIMKISDDESIFAWRAQPESDQGCAETGILAQSPAEFKDSAQVKMIGKNHHYHHYRTVLGGQTYPYSMTNKGIAIKPHLKLMIDTTNTASSGGNYPFSYEATLNCWNIPENSRSIGEGHQICIYLIQRNEETPLRRIFAHHFARTTRKPLFADSLLSKTTTLKTPEVEALPSDALIYVAGRLFGGWPHVPAIQLEVDIIGDNLQSRLQKITTPYNPSGTWVEPTAFEFKLIPYDRFGNNFNFYFKDRDPAVENNIVLSFVRYGYEITITVRSLKPDETFGEAAAGRSRLIQRDWKHTEDIVVSQPIPGKLHYKIWLLDDQMSSGTRDSLLDSRCKIKDEDAPFDEGYQVIKFPRK